MRHALLLLLVLLTSLAAEARPRPLKNFYALDLGAYGTNLYERFTVNPENAKLVSTLSGYARIRRGWKLSRRFLFEPSLGTMVPWRSGNDGTTMTFLTHLDVSLGWQLLSWLKLRGGPGLQMILIASKGTTVPLSNGGGTSDFYTPNGARCALLSTAALGFELLLSKSLSLNLDAYLLQPLDRERRSLNAAATLGIRL